jgi:hypothetical protein
VEAPVSEAAPPPPPDDGCPDELAIAVDAPRKIDTRKAPIADWNVYKRKKWVPGHRRLPGKAFVRTSEAVLATVLAIEAKNPKLIPAAYRERLLASPRDAALRLEMAACEVKQPATMRRGAYDAAIALLLAGPADQALPLLETGAWGPKEGKSWCGEGHEPCAEGSYCDLGHGYCVSKAVHGHVYISDDELAIEDALTRALFRDEILGKTPQLPKDARGAWMYSMLHRCGKLTCHLSGYIDDDGEKLVVWDRRDGGAERDIPLSKAEVARIERCEGLTGFRNAEACRDDCNRRFSPEGSAGWPAQERCNAVCDRDCR